MFLDRGKLRKALSKLVGFYQTNSDVYSTLSPSLVKSSIKRWVNGVNGLIDVENIDQSRSNFSALNLDTWDAATAYDEEDLVNDGGNFFEAIENVPMGTLTTDSSFWFPLDSLNMYLLSKRLQGVDKMLDSVFTAKKMRAKVKSIFENIALFDGFGRDKQTNANKFVGLRFIAKSDRDIITVINMIGHQFTEAVSFNLYLYHSSQQAPLKIIPISHTKAMSSQWSSQTDLNIRYLDPNYDAGGEFFLGYAQSELGTSQAVNMYGLNWTNGYTCTSCKSYELYQNYSDWVSVMGFEISESAFTVGMDMFDPLDASYTPSLNYGLNINMTTECDLTPFLIQESDKLGEALQYSVGLEVLKDMASNTRTTNQRGNVVREQAAKQVVSFDGVNGTVLDETNSKLQGLSFDLSGLNSVCLPCDDGNADIIQRTVTLR